MFVIKFQQYCQNFVYKIHTTRLVDAKWHLTLSLEEARRNDELIALADSTVLRMIKEINNVSNIETRVNEIRNNIKYIRKQPFYKEQALEIKKLYKELDNLQFQPDYLCLVIDKNKDYMRAVKGFSVNSITYRRLLGTTGGIKNSTIVFVNEKIYDKLFTRINNDRDLTKKLVPAKFEAYLSLACSSSTVIPEPNGILVVDDCVTHFKSDIIHLDDTDVDEPIMKEIKDCDVELIDSDGYGLMTPEYNRRVMKHLGYDMNNSGWCLRGAFCKGMLYTFDFQKFATNVAHNYIVKDAWGIERDIRDVEVVLTTSMLKLWDSYNSIEHYLECCHKNGFPFSATKLCPEKLEDERRLNYQFLQSYQLSKDDIEELVSPTINEIKDIMGLDWRKSLLFLKGLYLNEDNIEDIEDDCIKALMISPNMINDPFVRSKIYNMIKKRINEAKIGTIKIRGNFSMVSGDPYSLCQSMFGLKVTGLLKAGQSYSKYWIEKNVPKVVCFRAPMTCHNNIRLLDMVTSPEMEEWYQYMNSVTIFNSWDTAAHALNGMDKDGDTVLTTDNPVLLRNTRELPAIMCVQRKAEKKIVEEADLIKSNIASFGDDIGFTTNIITGMFEVMANFDPDSEEYKVLDYRIKCGQLFQQNAIDKAKGIIAKPIPKAWYDRHINVVLEGDSDETIKKKEFNLRIMSHRKPYFMKYIYPDTMKEYNKFMTAINQKCLICYGMDFQTFRDEYPDTEDKKEFMHWYNTLNPVGENNCVVNYICTRIEKDIKSFVGDKSKFDSFDHTIMKSNVKYDTKRFNKIFTEYEKYTENLRNYAKSKTTRRLDEYEQITTKHVMSEQFRALCEHICPNADMLCNIVLDICYNRNRSKQFAWDMCADVIIKNLLNNTGNILHIPIASEDGDFMFNEQRFKIINKEIKEEIQ